MRKVMLLGVVMLMAVAASAQDHIVTVAPPSPAASQAPSAQNPFTDTSWQMSFGYQYNRMNLTGQPITPQGFDVSLVRFFHEWIGLEANSAFGFGNTHATTSPANLDVKTTFVAGGVHLTHRVSRIEPWVHILAGMEHYRFTQTSVGLGSNSGFAWDGGVGMDLYLNTRIALRGQADYLGTRIAGTIQRNFTAGGGFVVNF